MLQIELNNNWDLPGTRGTVSVRLAELLVKTVLILLWGAALITTAFLQVSENNATNLCSDIKRGTYLPIKHHIWKVAIADYSAGKLVEVSTRAPLYRSDDPKLRAPKSCEDLIWEACQCRTFAHAFSYCAITCPVPKAILKPDGKWKFPDQFWDFLASSGLYPFVFNANQPIESSSWFSTFNRWVWRATPIVMIIGAGAGRCARCTEKLRTVQTMNCMIRHNSMLALSALWFIVDFEPDFWQYALNLCRSDSSSLYAFLFVSGGLPHWMAVGIFVGFLTGLFFKILAMSILVTSVVMYLVTGITAFRIRRQLLAKAAAAQSSMETQHLAGISQN